MNQRCTCEPVTVERNGKQHTTPGLLSEDCPVHFAHGRRAWHRNECSPRIPGLAVHRRKITETKRYRLERKNGKPYEFDREETRWETSAEVQRRLYEEALS